MGLCVGASRPRSGLQALWGEVGLEGGEGSWVFGGVLKSCGGVMGFMGGEALSFRGGFGGDLGAVWGLQAL